MKTSMETLETKFCICLMFQATTTTKTNNCEFSNSRMRCRFIIFFLLWKESNGKEALREESGV